MLAKARDAARLNTSSDIPDRSSETPLPAVKPEATTPPDFTQPPKPIGEFAGRPDFPQCVLGEHLDIGGRTGVVVQVVNQSLKVRSPQGAVQSFNAQTLRKLYGPVVRPEPEPPRAAEEVSYARPKPLRSPKAVEAPEEPLPEAPPRVFIEEPDFDLPLTPITEFVDREDFPQCAYGRHVAIGEFAGVVVELVKQSLKVRDADGYLRSYNGPILRKLYGQAGG